MQFFKNYKSSIILLCSIIIGSLLGIIFGEDIKFLQPFGDLFINMLLVIIVPLVFLTISSSIGKMKQPKRIGKVLITIIVVFVLTSLVSVFVGLISSKSIKLVTSDGNKIIDTLGNEEIILDDVNYFERTVNMLSVNDFNGLLSKNNMIALIVFAILIGFSINLAKEKGKTFLNLIDSANEVVQKFVHIIMFYAPIGLGCYFAVLVGTLGGSIAVDYIRTFIVYTIVAVLFYFIVYSFYAYISAGKKGFIYYWKNIFPATITSLATCSSAASIPVNVECTKKIGVPDDIANTTIPLGTNFHKDGSVIGSVFKIMFLVYLFNSSIDTPKIILVALLATLLVTAVPIGGGTISEMLIITLLGFPAGALPILTIIATIIDAPATMLNVVGDTASSMLVTRIVDGKNWLKKSA